jgi:hypothetical protein
MRVTIPFALLVVGFALVFTAFSGNEALAQAGAAALPVAVTDTDPEAVDVAGVRESMVVLGDDKGHYVALVPFGSVWEHFYYGDGKVMWAQRVQGGGASGKESFDRTFWDPRIRDGWQRSVGFREGKYSVQCEGRKTELKVVGDADRLRLLASAKWRKHLWKRKAYALARDQTGKYFYVDTGNEERFAKAFKLYAGPRGDMKLLPMTNVVSDSEGDIFATKKGTLRLVLDKRESLWVEKGKESKLVLLAVEDNVKLIYTDLGPYLGQKLGTPCDDL